MGQDTRPTPLASVNRQRLYHEDTPGPGLPVVFSHGLLMDHEMFEPQVEHLRGRRRVVTWDQRSHGKTETSSEPYTYWDSAADLAGLLDHLEIERAVLAGMSQGGFLSLRFALKWPERVAGLFLIDTQAGPEPPEAIGRYGVMLEVWEEEGLTDPIAEAIAAAILGNEWPGRGPWIEKWRRLDTKRLRQPWDCLCAREDIHARLAEIQAPAAVVHGMQDVAIEMDLAERLCSGLPGCRGLHRVQGAGHASNLTHPEPVNRVLDDFLGGLQS